MSIRNLKFVKEPDGWFIDLPEWKGDHDDLQMIAGADKLIEFAAAGRSEVNVRLLRKNTTEPVKVALARRQYSHGGAIYDVIDYTGAIFTSKQLPVAEIWICSVTRYVLHVFPEVLNITWD